MSLSTANRGEVARVDPAAWLKRISGEWLVIEAIQTYKLTGNPTEIEKAMALAKRFGLAQNPSWRAALARARKREGRPVNAQLVLSLARLDSISAALWPEMHEHELQQWLARELRLSPGYVRVLLHRMRRRPRVVAVRPNRKKKKPLTRVL